MSDVVPEHVRKWVATVPQDDASVIRLTGNSVTPLPDGVSLVVTRTRLTFAPEDVVRLVPAYPPRPAVLYLRRGSLLLSGESSDAEGAPARRPFALSVRGTVARAEAAPRFRELEQGFLRTHGLIATE